MTNKKNDPPQVLLSYDQVRQACFDYAATKGLFPCKTTEAEGYYVTFYGMEDGSIGMTIIGQQTKAKA